MMINPNDLVLFQGDSITDTGRDRELDSLGIGYVYMIASWFSSMYPEMNVRFVNRGIGGDRVRDLEQRWEKDCLALSPDVLTIMIGLNDTWRRYDASDPTSVDSYHACYKRILTKIKEHSRETKLVLMEPFLLPVVAEQKKWREDLDPKIQAGRELAREFGAVYIPLDGLFAEASTKRELTFWARDGIHPTGPGHALIARAWLKSVMGHM